MSNPTTALIELRHHYQSVLTQAEYQANQAKEHLAHIDALLVNGLVQTQPLPDLQVEIASPELPALAPAAPLPVDALSEDSLPPPTVSARQSKATAAKAATSKASSRQESVSLLPEYTGMTKLEAITKVLTEQSGHTLHQDTITQLLYGDLDPEILKVESRRMRASLFQGLRKSLWQRAPKQPSCYQVKANSRKSKAPDETVPRSRPKPAQSSLEPPARTRGTAPKAASRGREQVLSLPAEFGGLSKIDAVAKVLETHAGTVVHMDDIIERLYGKLTGDALRAEKDRMKNVVARGIKQKLWRKAEGVPSSIIVGDPKFN